MITPTCLQISCLISHHIEPGNLGFGSRNAADAIMALFDPLAARVAELEAREFVPITKLHRDGEPHLVGWWKTEKHFCRHVAAWDKTLCVWYDEFGKALFPTHAAPLTPPPALPEFKP